MNISPPKMMLVLILCLAVLSLSGCALLSIPGQIIGGTFSMIGQLLGLIQKLPKPPPWVFI
ncbi:MAG: DUF3568 domain-containing protein [Candidatus Omnitrophica bacterium]|nr:DUF3568 domain-containing protein [Candidatus Omnitrophota bacterium]